MSDERILEVIENNDKYYVLGFINGIKADRDILKQENIELKKQLYEASLQIQELYEQDIECPSNCSKLKELKKQLSSNTLELEEYKKQVNKGLYSTCLPYTTGYNKAIEDYKNQQQEFIKYLEDEMERKRKEATCMVEYNETVLPLKEILQKYKEIIGGNKDE